MLQGMLRVPTVPSMLRASSDGSSNRAKLAARRATTAPRRVRRQKVATRTPKHVLRLVSVFCALVIPSYFTSFVVRRAFNYQTSGWIAASVFLILYQGGLCFLSVTRGRRSSFRQCRVCTSSSRAARLSKLLQTCDDWPRKCCTVDEESMSLRRLIVNGLAIGVDRAPYVVRLYGPDLNVGFAAGRSSPSGVTHRGTASSTPLGCSLPRPLRGHLPFRRARRIPPTWTPSPTSSRSRPSTCRLPVG